MKVSIVEYKGRPFPIRAFTVTHEGDNDNHTYFIAPESLLDMMEKQEGDDATSTDGTEAQIVDSFIYYYLADEHFFRDGKTICENHLDIPMIFINEEVL